MVDPQSEGVKANLLADERQGIVGPTPPRPEIGPKREDKSHSNVKTSGWS